jgi:hypothetical protein
MAKSRKKKRTKSKSPSSPPPLDDEMYFMPGKTKHYVQTTYRQSNGKRRALSISGDLRPFDEERWKRLAIALTYHIHEQRKRGADQLKREPNEDQGSSKKL